MSKSEPFKKLLNKLPGVELPVSENFQILPTSASANVSVTIPPEERVRDKVGKRFKKLFRLETGDIVLDEENSYQLTTWDRYILFAITFGISICSFLICFFLFPFLLLKPTKFSAIWTIGSVFFLIAFSILQGVTKFWTNLVESKNLPFTISFIGSIVLTIVSTLVLKSTILVLVGVILQMLSMIWYCFGYFPLSLQQLRFGSSLASSQVEGWMNS